MSLHQSCNPRRICRCKLTCGRLLTKRQRDRHYAKADPDQIQDSESPSSQDDLYVDETEDDLSASSLLV